MTTPNEHTLKGCKDCAECIADQEENDQEWNGGTIFGADGLVFDDSDDDPDNPDDDPPAAAALRKERKAA